MAFEYLVKKTEDPDKIINGIQLNGYEEIWTIKWMLKVVIFSNNLRYDITMFKHVCFIPTDLIVMTMGGTSLSQVDRYLFTYVFVKIIIWILMDYKLLILTMDILIIII